MSRFWKRFAVAAAAMSLSAAALAAAPGELDPADGSAAIVSPLEYQLDKEMVVRDWVICTTQSFAESIARARDTGLEAAQKVYTDLKDAKSCGLFPELRVILRERLYQSAPGLDHEAQVFAASVNIGGGWPSGFVVNGGLAAE